ncbi:MAG: hypothetical protein OEZ19_09210, partial [Paracoccaceae bacterium]|nr:hypothetical protein [Paracoccaceae bacterium]
QPVMGLLNLPPEAAVVCLTSVFVGLYGAIAALPVLVGLEMTAAQFTGLCMFMLFAHALPVEQAIIRKAGGSYWHSAAVRLLAGGFSSFMVGWLSRATGYLDHPQSLDHLAQMGGRDSTFVEWLVASATGLAVLFLILTALLMLLDILTKLRITLVIGWLLSPVLRLSGLDRSVATITTAGVLLGVGFGGGLIIAERDNPEISEAARKRALLWIALCHGMIEDVGLLAAVGGNALVMIIGRVGLTLAIFGIWTAGQHLLASRAGYSPPD